MTRGASTTFGWSSRADAGRRASPHLSLADVTRYPDTYIIGAPKSGTTSLYEYLRGHPEVFLPEVKEPCYFSRDLARDKAEAYGL